MSTRTFYIILAVVAIGAILLLYSRNANNLRTTGGELGACIAKCRKDCPTCTTDDCEKDCKGIIGIRINSGVLLNATNYSNPSSEVRPK